MKMTYENAAEEITLEEAINAYKYGIATIITDGKRYRDWETDRKSVV